MHWPAIYYTALLMLLFIFFMFRKVGLRQKKKKKSLVCGLVGMGTKKLRGKQSDHVCRSFAFLLICFSFLFFEFLFSIATACLHAYA